MTAELPQDFLRLPVAHRALHDLSEGRPENGPAAIAAAVNAGYAIEIDLQLSADGEAMVFHDDDLDRLTAATGPVRARPAAELCALCLNGGADDRIPMLADVLTLVAGQVPLLIELKDQSQGAGVGPLEAATARALEGYAGPVAVMSFNPNSVAEMARLAPGVPRGLTTCAFDDGDSAKLPEATRAHLRDIADFDRVGASFISHDLSDLTAAPVTALKARGVPVLCWTVRTPAQEAAARRVACNITFEQYLA